MHRGAEATGQLRPLVSPTGARPASASPPRLLLAVLAFVIVLLAGWLRFRGIESTQIFRSDEGFYHLEARRLAAQVEACRTVFRIFRTERPAGLLRLDPARTRALEELVAQGYGQLGGRFLHDAFLAIALATVGPYDWTGNAMAALFGILTVVLVGLWASVLLDDTGAVYGVALLTCSSLHLVYSRATLAETDLAFFVTLCLALQSASFRWPRWEWPLLLLAGFVFGLGFLTSLRAVPLAYAILACELTSRRPRAIVPALTLFGLGALTPLVIAEAFFHTIFLFSAYSGVLLARHTLAMNVIWLFFRFNGGVVNPGTVGMSLYPRFLAAVETPVFLAAGAAGLILASLATVRLPAEPTTAEGLDRRRGLRPLVVGTLVIGAYWQFAVSIKAVRYLSMLLPLFAVLGACALVALERRLTTRFAASAVIVGLTGSILALSIPRTLAELPQGPSYREVAAYLRELGAPRFVATQVNVFRVWFEGEHVTTADSMEALRKLHAAGYRYYVGCFQKYHQTTASAVIALEAALERTPPLREFPHPRGDSWHTWMEGGVLAPDPAQASDATRIRVWDLDRVFASLSEKSPPLYTPAEPR